MKINLVFLAPILASRFPLVTAYLHLNRTAPFRAQDWITSRDQAAHQSSANSSSTLRVVELRPPGPVLPAGPVGHPPETASRRGEDARVAVFPTDHAVVIKHLAGCHVPGAGPGVRPLPPLVDLLGTPTGNPWAPRWQLGRFHRGQGGRQGKRARRGQGGRQGNLGVAVVFNLLPFPLAVAFALQKTAGVCRVDLSAGRVNGGTGGDRWPQEPFILVLWAILVFLLWRRWGWCHSSSEQQYAGCENGGSKMHVHDKCFR